MASRCPALLAAWLAVACGDADDGGGDGGGGDGDGLPVGSDEGGPAGGDGSGAGDGAGGDAPGDGDDGDDAADDTTGGAALDPAIATFFARMPGLWAAPVTSETSVGDFPIMNMDVRAADDRTLFCRVDLDADNSLRFSFAVEHHDGLGEQLVFRNGGYFLGFLRDTRTSLVEHDPATDTFRFCAIAGGCGYVDARLTLPEGDAMELVVEVLGMHHFRWAPQRMQARALPEGFDPAPGDAADPFPPMPTLELTATLPHAAEDDAFVWLVLWTEPCMPMLGAVCPPSRFLRAPVLAGDDEVVLGLDQIHAGDYFALAILDRNDNLATTLLPDDGDAVSLPNLPVTVAADGTTEATIDIMLEL